LLFNTIHCGLHFVLCTPGKTYKMEVSDHDYLRLLQGGNFINFVCMVLDRKDKKSVVASETFRLKVGYLIPSNGINQE